MNNDLLNISLNQGKQFNSDQQKIIQKTSKKEGFDNLEQNNVVSNSNIQQKIENDSLDTINSVGSNNSYLGKNLQFTDGTIAYVNYEGIVQPYTSTEIFNGTIGKNGCPKEIVNLSIPWSSEYIQGTKISIDPNISIDSKLIVGSDMVMEQPCGNDVVLKMGQLYNQNNNNFKKLKNNSEQFKKNLENYKLTNLRIQQNINGLQNLKGNNIEGMENLTNSLNLNDLNGMLSDSDTQVLQENYSYILWSLLAVGILTITIITMKNRN